ncbi:hypothetical protein A3A21_03425 [Candidatus Jorgensenbacteria bacterium RIFCSPLOWO2_01_FULL_45_25b]|uniref:Ribose-5-phosphate isomerase n=1 Tax=Candidatus Jorgensenbacteria bacterium RIFCSPLOWO2_01_FULL_45_25b TaxID=1798471 RepID=A0A1F6BYU1_9BACT|nr:MAG: hypothetical protein A3A21_03425 [Candidatus Jorgensenbacteria bacterium RIFCSPLOWO2_01_FULL_45_25b]
MNIYIGADHRGFELKEQLKQFIQGLGYPIVDVGNTRIDEADDYPDFARAVAEKVSGDYEHSRGILLCGSGIGVSIVANKFPRVRAGLVMTSDQAFDSRNDDDTNVIALPASYLGFDDMKRIVTTWLGTPFSEEGRHRRRRDKISEIEAGLQDEARKRGEDDIEAPRFMRRS